MQRLIILLILAVLLLANNAYSRKSINIHDSATVSCQLKAKHLLDEALGFMQKYYYRKNYVQWDTLIATAKAQLAASNSCEDSYDIITWCFRQLKETHSFLMLPEKASAYINDTATIKQKQLLSDFVGEIRGELIEDDIAYITVPWVSTTDSIMCMQVADSLQNLIARLDANPVNNWIIDLRKNTGGNCWPMLAGIGPLLGNGVCGYFVSANEKIPIRYSDGIAFQGKNIRCKTSNMGYKTKSDKKSIIILTGRKTVSSGEIIALAFKGKEQVYFYGEPTAGYTTANATYTLSDNSMLVLTVCMEADRTGKICEGKIMPDEIVNADTAANSHDPARSAAVMWLMSQSIKKP